MIINFCTYFFLFQPKYELEELVKILDGHLSEDEQVS